MGNPAESLDSLVQHINFTLIELKLPQNYPFSPFPAWIRKKASNLARAQFGKIIETSSLPFPVVPGSKFYECIIEYIHASPNFYYLTFTDTAGKPYLSLKYTDPKDSYQKLPMRKKMVSLTLTLHPNRDTFSNPQKKLPRPFPGVATVYFQTKTINSAPELVPILVIIPPATRGLFTFQDGPGLIKPADGKTIYAARYS